MSRYSYSPPWNLRCPWCSWYIVVFPRGMTVTDPGSGVEAAAAPAGVEAHPASAFHQDHLWVAPTSDECEVCGTTPDCHPARLATPAPSEAGLREAVDYHDLAPSEWTAYTVVSRAYERTGSQTEMVEYLWDHGYEIRPIATSDGETRLRSTLEILRDHGYQPTYNGRPSCPFCGNFIDDEETHAEGCELVAALALPPAALPALDEERLARALHVANPIGSVAHIAAGVDDPGRFLDGWDEEHIARHRDDAAAIAAAYAREGAAE